MASPRIQDNFRMRKSFGKIKPLIDIPNLIDTQKRSYDKFLQLNVDPMDREDVGLQGIFKSVFPIMDFNKTAQLEFVSYNLETPKYDVDECRQRGMTFAATVLTLYPEMFPGPLGVSLAGRALERGDWSCEAVQIRDFATDKHRTVDDTPAGGGAGMVLKPDVLGCALGSVADERPNRAPPADASLSAPRFDA